MHLNASKYASEADIIGWGRWDFELRLTEDIKTL